MLVPILRRNMLSQFSWGANSVLVDI